MGEIPTKKIYILKFQTNTFSVVQTIENINITIIKPSITNDNEFIVFGETDNVNYFAMIYKLNHATQTYEE